MRLTIILIFLAVMMQSVHSQKLVSRNSHIWFSASTPLEDILAHNRQAVSILDPATGSLAFNLLVKSFEFKVALMQEHFNENYLESDKYPKSTFQGKINNNADIDYKKDGTYKAEVSGDLTIHNVTHPVNTTGTIEVKEGVVTAKSQFIVKPVDYNITIPSVVENKIAKEVEVNIEATYAENK
ncbi:MAG TPA: YceI family protein [Bacteroidales bacterium]|jgi:polyisoprenoid-binding protein YceI|nr:YceI family protein [Bacteroidales bacterium]